MKFDTGEKGLELGLEGGHTRRRVLHAGGSSTGREMVKFLIAAVESNKSIKKFESTGVVGFFSDGVSCSGALAVGGETGPVAFISKSTILATGGASALYERTTNPEGATGEGIALAYEAGAEISDMEFVQFHPTAFYNKDGASFLISEAVRGEGPRQLAVHAGVEEEAVREHDRPLAVAVQLVAERVPLVPQPSHDHRRRL